MIALYLTGILVGIIVAKISQLYNFKGSAVPFVMELPNYRLPSAKNVLQLLWEKAKDFLTKAFTIITLGTIIVWFLQNFDFGLHMVSDSSNSMLAAIASAIAPIFMPLGFGDWRVTVSLISGFLAKESVVSTLNILFGGMDGLRAVLTSVAAAALLVFCLLYTPCIAAISAVKRELGTRWAIRMVLMQCAIAYVCAVIVVLVGVIIC